MLSILNFFQVKIALGATAKEKMCLNVDGFGLELVPFVEKQEISSFFQQKIPPEFSQPRKTDWSKAPNTENTSAMTIGKRAQHSTHYTLPLRRQKPGHVKKSRVTGVKLMAGSSRIIKP